MGVLPDQEDRMHNWDKVVVELGEVRRIHELDEPVLKDGHISVGIVGFDLGLLDFLLELLEWLVVGGLGLKEEFEDLLHLLRLELVMDGVQILGFVLPECNFDKRVWMTTFQSLLWLQLQNVFDLLGPHDNTAFENMCFILLRNVVSLS